MLQEIYVAIGLVTFVYFLLKKKRREVVVEITPLQPPETDSGSPMSVCDSDIDSDEDLLNVTPLQFREDYIELYQKQTTHT